MNPWEHPTCVALMDAIDNSGDYDRLPYLADALEDAGDERAEVLAGLRAVRMTDSWWAGAGTICGPWWRRVVTGVVAPVAVYEAGAWLGNFADSVRDEDAGAEGTLSWLLGVLDAAAEDGDYYFTYEGSNDPDVSDEDTQAMWRHYETLTGKGPAKSRYSSGDYPRTVFSCSC